MSFDKFGFNCVFQKKQLFDVRCAVFFLFFLAFGSHYMKMGTISTFESKGVALDVLRRISSAVQKGIECKHIQRLPHGKSSGNPSQLLLEAT